MENQLELIAKSYDKGIECGKKGINLYNDLPEYITNNPNFQKWKQECTNGDSGSTEIIEYLLPDTNMRFIDLGCCLNLMFRGYDKWPSIYHGVDISNKTIQLLNKFATEKKLSIGSLFCGSIHETPFEDNYFDIGACIGVLEYFEQDFVEQSIIEMQRILKPKGKIVLDIPNISDETCQLMMLIEEHLGRPDRFNMQPPEFEDMLKKYFVIEKADTGPMIQYFLKCKK
ncbi:class I SAM-dependent methyltransferase [Clostridium sp. Marseille-P299]|uniref:class I SAM-dependent methyltransferase n=1 Tax=Clostridium sp. Marseille-P299 TaxID=1805477 RepID=UPI00082C2EFD|nr:class I SAM-dependent methyltransferase [Clostridium sp. Marseille-P299]